jgi:hypothetical protein
MLWEYKIQKVKDGNGDERFNILMCRVGSNRFWRKKQWIVPDRYGVKDSFTSLGRAQNVIMEEMKKDAKTEYNQNKNKTRVMKEFSYTEIPDHIPEEQEETFCDLSEVKT